MHIGAMSYFNPGILGVMTAQIIFDLRMAWISIDCRWHAFPALCQNFQNPVINIVVYKNDSPCGFPD